MDAEAMNTQDNTLPPVIPPSNPNPPFMNTPPTPEPPPRVRIRTGRSFPYGTALIALIVIALSAGALYLFGDAKVAITPESHTADINGPFTATAGSGDLPFTVESITKTVSASVPAESTLTAKDSAQGTITVSNAQTKPQTLINSTRFATPTGLIFHIHAPITVPAATATGPGKLTIAVYADQAGESYNVAPTTFTVPGLKGSAQFDEVTATSNTAMVGGFSGTRAAVSQSTDDTQHAILQTALAKSLQTDLNARVPAGYVLLPGSTLTSFQALPDTASTTSTVAVGEQGTLTAVVFPGDALAKAIAYKIAGTYSGEPVSLGSVAKLILAPASSTDPTNAQTYSFNLNGTATIIWKVDTSKIAGAVAGKTRDSAQAILAGFPEVNSALLTLRPFWTSKFPVDPSHIKVTVTTPPAGS